MDPLSPLAPAYTKALLVPVGKIKSRRFTHFVDIVRKEAVVRLGDISPDQRSDRTKYSPLAFPDGQVQFEICTAMPNVAHLALSPIELFREPLLIIGVADGFEYAELRSQSNGTATGDDDDSLPIDSTLHELVAAVDSLEELYSSAIVHTCLIFDSEPTSRPPWLPENARLVPPIARQSTTAMKTILCDTTSLVLAEMTTFAKSVEALPVVPFPSSKSSSGRQATSNSVYRTKSARTEHRMTLPVNFHRDIASLGQTHSRPTSSGNGQATHPSSSSSVENLHELSKRRSHHRAVESVHSSSTPEVNVSASLAGFGSGSAGQQERDIHKLRIRLVHGSLYLMAGLWPEALSHFIDISAKAETFQDVICQIRALELAICTVLLLCKVGASLEIPLLLAGNERRRMSRSGDPSALRSLTFDSENGKDRLFQSLPVVIEVILNLLKGSQGTLQSYPQPGRSDLVTRLVILLNSIRAHSGLTTDFLESLTLPSKKADSKTSGNPAFDRIELYQTLFMGYPSTYEIEKLPGEVAIEILSQLCKVCGVLDLARKRQLVQDELIKLLSLSLQKARKAGAADLGLHPAAGLAAAPDTGSGIHFLSPMDRNACQAFMQSFIKTFGVFEHTDVSLTELPAADKTFLADLTAEQVEDLFASQKMDMVDEAPAELQLSCLSSCMRLCEALSDFRGYLHFAGIHLRRAIASSMVDPDGLPVVILHEAVQHSIFHGIQRAVVSAQAHLDDDIRAEFWDPRLVRDISINPPSGSYAVEKLKPMRTMATQSQLKTQAGVFLHNPFTQKTDDSSKIPLVVAGERFSVEVRIQNPFAFTLEIANISLVSSGGPLASRTEPLELPGRSFRRVIVHATASMAGSLRILGCQVEVKPCRSRFFPLQSRARDEGDNKIKSAHSLPAKTPRLQSLSLEVVEPQPLLRFSNHAQNSVMVLENETRTISIDLINRSDTAEVDSIYPEIESSQAMEERPDSRQLSRAEIYELEWKAKHAPPARLAGSDASGDWIPWEVQPQANRRITFDILGSASLRTLTFTIHYRRRKSSGNGEGGKIYARKVSQSVKISVLPSIQLSLLGVLPFVDPAKSKASTQADKCLLRLELQNRWCNPLKVELQAQSTGESTSAAAAVTQSAELGPTASSGRRTILLPIDRLRVENALELIPLRQQFIHDKRLSRDEDMANREMFWYGEKLSSLVSGTWQDDGPWRSGQTKRRGAISLRGQKLTAEMIDCLKLRDIDLQISMKPSSDAPDDPLGLERWLCSISLTNRLKVTARVILFVDIDKICREVSGSVFMTPIRTFSPDLNGTLHELEPGVDVVLKLWIIGLDPGEVSAKALIRDQLSRQVLESAAHHVVVPASAT